MKRKPIKRHKSPDYPSFEKFHTNRRKFLSTLGLGAAGVVLTSSCDNESRTGGIICEPQPAGVPLPPEPPPKQKENSTPPKHTDDFPAQEGEIAAPEPPAKLGGKPLPPRHPEKKQEKKPAVPGKIKPPAPPKKPPAATDKKEEFPELGGDIAMPAPPKDTTVHRTLGIIMPPKQ